MVKADRGNTECIVRLVTTKFESLTEGIQDWVKGGKGGGGWGGIRQKACILLY